MFGLSRTAVTLAAAALVYSLLVAVGGLAFWRGMAAIERMTEAAATAAREERDAHYRAEIAASNARIAAERAEAAIAAASTRAQEEIARLQSTVTELEAQNAALPAAADRVWGVPKRAIRATYRAPSDDQGKSTNSARLSKQVFP
jgi:hypothetical protein